MNEHQDLIFQSFEANEGKNKLLPLKHRIDSELKKSRNSSTTKRSFSSTYLPLKKVPREYSTVDETSSEQTMNFSKDKLKRYQFLASVTFAIKRRRIYNFCDSFLTAFNNLIKDEPDPLHIKSELGLILVIALLGAVLWGILEFIYQDIYFEGNFYWGYLLQLTYNLVFFIMIPLQIHKSYTFDEQNEERKYDILSRCISKNKNLKSEYLNKISLTGIMESKTGSKLFKAFCVKEQCLENLYFWEEAKKFRNEFEDCEFEYNRSLFCFLYDIFIDRDQPLAVNIGGEEVEKIKQIYLKVSSLNLKKHDERFAAEEYLDDTVFDTAIADIYSLLQFGPFSRFTQDKDYKKLMEEFLYES
eukprot:snap_masked-scaffold_2-processed-gene-22.10-mRNA-1 protein AED:1.00 eAED:1.00 QI:0/0/0/0/1/1/3/0/357